jgi:hypothetical protein
MVLAMLMCKPQIGVHVGIGCKFIMRKCPKKTLRFCCRVPI